MGIRIDALPPAASAAADHEIPAIKDDETVRLSVGQISTLVIATVTDSAPATLDTLNELAAALGDDPNFATTVTNSLAAKADASTTNINGLAAKTTPVDADELRVADSAASFGFKKLSFADLWAWIRGKVLTLFNASGSAPVYACRAWVNFNGAGTVAIRASGNVSSITDNGTGVYTINFTTALPDTNYAWTLGGSALAGYVITARNDQAAPTTTSLRVGAYNASAGAADADYINAAIFR